MAEYRLTAKAEADLVEIARYTRQQWGEKQRNTYMQELFEVFVRVAMHPQLGKPRDEVRPGLKSRQHKRTHIVFYRIADDQVVDILRVLHVRQDVGKAFDD